MLSTLRVRDSEQDIEAWVRQRMGRQAILTRRKPPQLHWILTELGMRQPVGGATVMARQIRRLVELAERTNINMIPANIVEHPGLLGQFVILDFAQDEHASVRLLRSIASDLDGE